VPGPTSSEDPELIPEHSRPPREGTFGARAVQDYLQAPAGEEPPIGPKKNPIAPGWE
jgi:hypothetical protein